MLHANSRQFSSLNYKTVMQWRALEAKLKRSKIIHDLTLTHASQSFCFYLVSIISKINKLKVNVVL